MVGDGIERKKIEDQILRYELQNDIVLVGNQSNPYPYIKNADLFVHPSWVESQGITVLEAIVLGKTCVVVRSEGTEEYLKDQYNSIIAERSIESLADKVYEALSNLDCIDFQENQRNTLRRFQPEVNIDKLYRLMNKK